MSKKVPNSLIKKQNIVKLVLFVVFFAFLFIIIFKPFNSNKFLSISTDRFAAYASIIAAIGLGSVRYSVPSWVQPMAPQLISG